MEFVILLSIFMIYWKLSDLALKLSYMHDDIRNIKRVLNQQEKQHKN